MHDSSLMPAIFFGHGNPMNAIEDNRWARAWAALGAALPRPKAILSVSAHWYLPMTAVTAMPRPRTIHDFGGFPRPLFEVQYPAPGSPALAQRVTELLAPTQVTMDDRRRIRWRLHLDAVGAIELVLCGHMPVRRRHKSHRSSAHKKDSPM